MDRETTPGVVSFADHFPRSAPTKSYSMLIADSDQTNPKLLAQQLERAGHAIKLVTNGEQALDAFDQAEADFDVVILDSDMPVMSGLEAAHLIPVMQAERGVYP
jgi:CheY-like chemotaxis protein